MKLTILPIDNAVYKDGISYLLDLTTDNIPNNVHALQFNDVVNAGWIEFVEDDFGNKQANQPITELPFWAITVSAKWDEAKIADDAAKKAAEEANIAAMKAAAEAAIQPQATNLPTA